jgi:hypothetical protein
MEQGVILTSMHHYLTNAFCKATAVIHSHSSDGFVQNKLKNLLKRIRCEDGAEWCNTGRVAVKDKQSVSLNGTDSC